MGETVFRLIKRPIHNVPPYVLQDLAEPESFFTVVATSAAKQRLAPGGKHCSTTEATLTQVPGRFARIVRAQPPLPIMDLKVVETSLESGFGSLSDLNTIFGGHVGEKPSRYRVNLLSKRVE